MTTNDKKIKVSRSLKFASSDEYVCSINKARVNFLRERFSAY